MNVMFSMSDRYMCKPGAYDFMHGGGGIGWFNVSSG